MKRKLCGSGIEITEFYRVAVEKTSYNNLVD